MGYYRIIAEDGGNEHILDENFFTPVTVCEKVKSESDKFPHLRIMAWQLICTSEIIKK